MKTAAVFAFAGFTFCVATSCFATEQASRQQIINYEVAGNLESRHALGCIGAENLSSKFTPADLYQAVSLCAQQGRNREGTLLFALAGAYGRFDMLRVSDKTAHQAVTVLRMQAFGGMAPDQQNALKESVKNTLGSPDGLAAVCKEIKRIGPPNYHPGYMIQHGMGAFTRAGTDTGLVKEFNAAAAWKQSLDTYLHCQN